MFDQFSQLLHQRVSRRRFILITGTFLIALFGISGMAKRLNIWQQTSVVKGKPFSSGPYGG